MVENVLDASWFLTSDIRRLTSACCLALPLRALAFEQAEPAQSCLGIGLINEGGHLRQPLELLRRRQTTEHPTRKLLGFLI